MNKIIIIAVCVLVVFWVFSNSADAVFFILTVAFMTWLEGGGLGLLLG